MSLRQHIPPIMHNALGTLLAATITGFLGLCYAIYAHSHSVSVPLWLLIACGIVVVSAFTFIVLRYRNRVRELTLERDRLQGKVLKQDEAAVRYRYPRTGWMSGFRKP